MLAEKPKRNENSKRRAERRANKVEMWKAGSEARGP
jgi:hypothetical protein